jgi:osmotically-inducible protein OsmY
MFERTIAEPPNGLKGADRRLFLAVRRRLLDHEPLRASHPQLGLDVDGGTVRLGGRVRTLALKEIAGYLCKRLEGVQEVRNELLSDTEVQRQVADALAADDKLGPLCLRVDVRDGVASLSGDLPTPELEEQAVRVARRAPGVADVRSELAVRPPQRPPTAPSKPLPVAEAAGTTTAGGAAAGTRSGD